MLHTQETAAATGLRVENGRLIVTLDGGRDVLGSIADTESFRFLLDASGQASANWTIEPTGVAIFWPTPTMGWKSAIYSPNRL